MIQGVYMDEFKKCLNYEDALRIISEAKTIAKEIAANSYRKFQQRSIELMMEVL
jgi:predicted metal-binding protein